MYQVHCRLDPLEHAQVLNQQKWMRTAAVHLMLLESHSMHVKYDRKPPTSPNGIVMALLSFCSSAVVQCCAFTE